MRSKTMPTNEDKKYTPWLKPTKVKDWLTEQDLYLGYRYKKRKVVVNSNGKVSVFHCPYVKAKESSSHEYSLFFDEWIYLQRLYWYIVAERLAQGDEFILPKNMGVIALMRIRPKSLRVSFGGTKVFRNMHTQGWKPKTVWRRRHEKGFNRKAC